MQLVDTFLFSEPYEVDLLLTKLECSSGGVLQWVIVENAYTFRGEYKGLFLKKIINTDPRFKKYKSRIVLLEQDVKQNDVFNEEDSKLEHETKTLGAEGAQRHAAFEFINTHFPDDTFLLVSDIDEFFDFSDTKKQVQVSEILNTYDDDVLKFLRTQFYWDIDNMSFVKRYSPVARLSTIRAKDIELGALRNEKDALLLDVPFVYYEYTACFTRPAIDRKFETYGHVGVQKTDVDRALKCNHSIKREQFGRFVGDKGDYDFLESITLHEPLTPGPILRNAEYMRTGVISKDYQENRKKEYPEVEVVTNLAEKKLNELKGIWADQVAHIEGVQGGIADAMNKLCAAFKKQGFFDVALKNYRQAVADYPSDPLLLYSYAVCLIQSGDWKGALPVISASANLAPDNPQITQLRHKVQSRVMHSVANRLDNEEWISWCRIVMNRETHALVSALDYNNMDALEISGAEWGDFGFKTFKSTAQFNYDLELGPLDEKFDIVIAEQVFEHLRFPYRAARNVLAMLKPGGHFLLTAPFLLKVHPSPFDCTRWTETGLKYFLVECGFEEDRIKTGSWGNADCVTANFHEWTKYRREEHSLENNPELPVMTWALAGPV